MRYDAGAGQGMNQKRIVIVTRSTDGPCCHMFIIFIVGYQDLFHLPQAPSTCRQPKAVPPEAPPQLVYDLFDVVSHTATFPVLN